MKKNICLIGITIALCFTILPTKAQTFDIPFVSYTPTFNVTQRNLGQVLLEDGVYNLVVEYKSNSTNYAQYKLEVRIQSDNVTHIYFDNGGYIHSGRNNSGYTWRGGGIKWNVDYYGNVTGGSAVIQVTYQGGRWQLFTIDF